MTLSISKTVLPIYLRFFYVAHFFFICLTLPANSTVNTDFIGCAYLSFSHGSFWWTLSHFFWQGRNQLVTSSAWIAYQFVVRLGTKAVCDYHLSCSAHIQNLISISSLRESLWSRQGDNEHYHLNPQMQLIAVHAYAHNSMIDYFNSYIWPINSFMITLSPLWSEPSSFLRTFTLFFPSIGLSELPCDLASSTQQMSALPLPIVSLFDLCCKVRTISVTSLNMM